MNDDSFDHFRELIDSLELEALRMAGRQFITLRIFKGSEMPVPLADTTAGIITGLETWITQHAQQSEVFEVSLDTLEMPSVASKLFDGLLECIQRLYRFHLTFVDKSGGQ